MTVNKTDNFQENFPFITCIRCCDDEYVGIVINYDLQVTSIYDLSLLKLDEVKQKFLELGDIWWWESNRKIPINIFLKADMQIFKPIIKTFNSKDVTVIFGPTVNLGDIAEKRIKRKSIQLVRNPRRKVG
jgi:hypothetical protein